MKKFFSVVFAAFLMLSLSLCSFAECLLQNPDVIPEDFIMPYALVPPQDEGAFIQSGGTYSSPVFTHLSQSGSFWTGSGGVLINTDLGYSNCFFIGMSTSWVPNKPVMWWNVLLKVTDSNGYVLRPSDISSMGIVSLSSSLKYVHNLGSVSVASDNLHGFSDGFLQFALSYSDSHSFSYGGYFLYVNVSNSSVEAPLSFQVEKFDYYDSESSVSVPPFSFPDSGHNVPSGPKDPNDHTQYGSASDQVEWYNDAFGAAVNPELDNKMSSTTSMVEQEQEIEDQMLAGLNQYAPSVDPANLTMPTQIVNGLQFIGNTFMSSFNSLGDVGFVISFSMMLGVVLVLIGRGESALARGMAASARERRRTEYASQRDMKKGG